MGTYRVYTKYIRIPGLRAHTKGPWFQPSIGLVCSGLRV